jgi:hypothetical protein
MRKFIGCTIGLECNKGNQIGKSVKIDYSQNDDGTINLQPVSGRNLSAMGKSQNISAAEFERRPQDAYDEIVEARWALQLCGWSLMHNDHNEANGR